MTYAMPASPTYMKWVSH